MYNSYAEKLDSEKQLKMKSVTDNLIDAIWPEQPARPTKPIMVLPVEFAGEEFTSKISKLRDEMKKKNAGVLVLSALDDIAC